MRRKSLLLLLTLLPQVSVAQEQAEYCLNLERGYKIQSDQLVTRFQRGAIDSSEFEAQRSEALRMYQSDAETCARMAQLPREVAPHHPKVNEPLISPGGRGIASTNTMYEEIPGDEDYIYDEAE